MKWGERRKNLSQTFEIEIRTRQRKRQRIADRTLEQDFVDITKSDATLILDLPRFFGHEIRRHLRAHADRLFELPSVFEPRRGEIDFDSAVRTPGQRILHLDPHAEGALHPIVRRAHPPCGDREVELDDIRRAGIALPASVAGRPTRELHRRIR